MFKRFVFVVLSLCTVANAQFTNGKCGKATIKVGSILGEVQCSKNDNAGPKHFQLAGDIQKLIVYSDDDEHMDNAGGPDPRTEVSLKAKPFTDKDQVEFEG